MRYVRLSNGRSPRSVLDKKLWSNQRDALSIAAQYLDSPSLDQAIIRMPTGTGKTAIIAVLAQLAADYPNVLIVAPWEHLAAQLHREVSSRFWQKSPAGTLMIAHRHQENGVILSDSRISFPPVAPPCPPSGRRGS
jgi:superfamily II DNA or RNA helicase